MNRSEALEALLAGKKIAYNPHGYEYVIYLKNNMVIYKDGSKNTLEWWLRCVKETYYEYVEKPKKVLLKDVP